MKIARVEAHHLENIPIQSPPYRELPNKEQALLVEIETDDGTVGWGSGGYAHPTMVHFINRYVAPLIIGDDPMRIDQISAKLGKSFIERYLGRFYFSAFATIDIALWDIKGKALGMPVHKLLGGYADKIPVYITHGAAYGNAPRYSVEELAAEAKHLADMGNTHLKNTVGRQPVPDPDDDYIRMKAMREAVGPDVKLAMDGNSRMTAAQSIRLCKLCEELNISFVEELVLRNDPRLLAEVKSQTMIPVAAGENHLFSARELLQADAVDIIQPNVNNDGGYTAGLQIAALAKFFNKPLGHGNGSGPHNIALQAGVSNGAIVEYHFHKWMAYNATYEKVPQPENGFLQVSQDPGTGLTPKDGLIKEFKVVD